MDRNEIEFAIVELDALLERDSDREADYQEWFERHPVVFASFGFQRVIPHPRFIDAKGAEWIPDFIVEPASKVWEVFEIKTPQAALLVDRDRRSKFYATFESYVSQVREYSDVLDDPRARDEFLAREGVAVQKHPRTTIIAGRSIGLDREKLHQLAASRLPPFTVVTFDDVRSQLEHYRIYHFGRYEQAKGYGVALVFVPQRPPNSFQNNHLIDIGVSPGRDRVSVFINPQHFLTLVAFDSNGERHIARALTPLEESDYARPHLLILFAGSGDGFGVLNVEMDGRYRADIRIHEFPFEIANYHVIGSDVTGTASGWFCLDTYMILQNHPTFAHRQILRSWAEEHRIRPSRNGSSEPWLVFEGRQSLRTEGHPYPAAALSGPSHKPCGALRP